MLYRGNKRKWKGKVEAIVAYIRWLGSYRDTYSTSTPFMLKLKEVMHIIWKKQLLNKHVSISITTLSSFILKSYFHFTLSFPFISSSVLLSFRTFDLVSRCILNSIYNYSNFVNYYFMIKFLIDHFIKICKEVLCYLLKFIDNWR